MSIFNSCQHTTVQILRTTCVLIAVSQVSQLVAAVHKPTNRSQPAGMATRVNLPGTPVSSGEWITGTPMPQNEGEVACGIIGNVMFLVGEQTSNTFAYDLVTGIWTNGRAQRPLLGSHHAAEVYNGKLYLIGGLFSGEGKVQIYDSAQDVWTLGADMPWPGGSVSTALINGKIYASGGIVGSMTVDSCAEYDPLTNVWTSRKPMPFHQGRNHAAASTDGRRFFIFGGRGFGSGDGNFLANGFDDVQIYNPITNTWTTSRDSGSTLSVLPIGRGGMGKAVYFRDEFYVLGGETLDGPGAEPGNVYNRVDIYNPSTNQWRTGPPMPTARHGIFPVLHQKKIYVAAGGLIAGFSASNILEILTLGASPVNFGKSLLQGTSSMFPTSLQFGPDGRLYVAQQDGIIKAYTILRETTNVYSVTAVETITLIQSIPNHNDDGTLNTDLSDRQVTGILVTGSASNPIIYVSSSDPRIGGGGSGEDLNLDTNSGIISRLTWNGSIWVKLDLVRGLSRSEENHASNGMQLDTASNTLYLAQGGNTNQGAPSNNFAFLPEYALSGAILAINLNGIGNTIYDLPTLDDEDRPGVIDANDPFGGNDGKNQAVLVPGGPVQVYSPGWRNPYDLLIAESGKMYSIDNGPNAGWGETPDSCTNAVNEPGSTHPDDLHWIPGPGFYKGHPNPTRGNAANTFNPSNPQSPVPTANPVECNYLIPGPENNALATWPFSTNGLAEFRASSFGGAMKGNLLAASFNNTIERIMLDSSGTAAASVSTLFSTVGIIPLDVAPQADQEIFPGTIWVADYADNAIIVFEPIISEADSCTGEYSLLLDEDGDGFANSDEVDNGTDPCSAADLPPDWDGDRISNLNDPDDDNDGLGDASDPFAIDLNNGRSTNLPVNYTWDSNEPNPGRLLNLGFTGLMSNGSSNYEDLFDPANMTAGGAAGVTTIDLVPEGDAFGGSNSQKYGFQFGINVGPTSPVFTARTRILVPFAGLVPQNFQSMGLFLGPGDQDNYVKVVTSANNGNGGIEFAKEVGGVFASRPQASVPMPGPGFVDLYLVVDPAVSTVQPGYSVTTAGVTGPITRMGNAEPIPTTWLTGASGLAASGIAVGIISTSAGPAPPFPASWDFIKVAPGNVLRTQLASFTGRFENGKVYLEWMTVTEVNNYGFEIQRSPQDSTHYATIPNSFVSGNGTTTVPHTYASVDSSPLPLAFYRLKQIDLDSTAWYSSGILISGPTPVATDQSLPTEFALHQNYPNPFNPSTSIEFTLPEQSFVSLKVYDLLGREVTILVHAEYPAGRYTVSWDGTDLQGESIVTGVYLCRFEARSIRRTSFIRVMKMALVR